MATECSNRNHSAAFPIDLPKWFIKLFTQPEDLVLDPFVRSEQRLWRQSNLDAGIPELTLVQSMSKCPAIGSQTLNFAYRLLAKSENAIGLGWDRSSAVGDAMNSLDLDRVCDFVNKNIVDFHGHRIKSLEELKLDKLLMKNPYLFKAKSITTAGELVSGLLDAFLSSSEEKLFGDFLERLAVFTAEMTCGGHKSAAPGWIWSSSTTAFTTSSYQIRAELGQQFSAG